MRIYIIKNKGADWFGNYRDGSVCTFGDESKCFIGFWFWRLKDAKKYLNALDVKEFCEIVKFDSEVEQRKANG